LYSPKSYNSPVILIRRHFKLVLIQTKMQVNDEHDKAAKMNDLGNGEIAMYVFMWRCRTGCVTGAVIDGGTINRKGSQGRAMCAGLVGATKRSVKSGDRVQKCK